jgi:hypothetical protein
VHDSKAATVDKFLAAPARASPYLPARLFAEPYAIRWMKEKAQ